MRGAPGLGWRERFPLEGEWKEVRVALEEGRTSQVSLPPGLGGLGDRWEPQGTGKGGRAPASPRAAAGATRADSAPRRPLGRGSHV